MDEDERRQKNQELKIKRKDYNRYDDDEFVPGQPGIKRTVLSKYDEVIDGDKEMVRRQRPRFDIAHILQQDFRLGSSMTSAKQIQVELQQQAAAIVNKSLLSVDYASMLFLPRRRMMN